MGNIGDLKIAIRNFRGCERADLTVSSIALLIGDGGASKSSVCQAVAAAATGEALPMPGLTKSRAGMLLRTGTDKASSKIEGEGFTAEVRWPKAEYQTDGVPPLVSRYAAGLSSILDLEPKKRGAVLAEYLKTTPSREDLIGALADEGFPAPMGKRTLLALLRDKVTDAAETPEELAAELIELGLVTAPSADALAEALLEWPSEFDAKEVMDALNHAGARAAAIESIWAKIEMDGWDRAWSYARDRGIEHKGGWRETTGEEYGSKKAESWFPKGWDENLVGLSVQSLERAVTEARSALEAAISEQAVSADELTRLTALAGTAPDTAEAVTAARNALAEAEAAVTTAEAERNALPVASQDSGLPCPHCNESVVVTKKGLETVLAKPAKVSPAELKKRRDAIASGDGAVAHARAGLTGARQAFDTANATSKTAQEAVERLAVVQNRKGGEAEVETARETLRLADERLSAFVNKIKADRLHRAVQSNQLVVDILAEGGLRKTKTIKVLDSFNQSIIGPICEAGGWKAVTVAEDMEIEYAGRSHPLLCKSEQARCRIAMQIAMAILDQSSLVVIDDADELPTGARGGLMQMLLHANLHAIVAMMVARPNLAPDLEKMGVGVTYWVSDGIATPLSALAEAA